MLLRQVRSCLLDISVWEKRVFGMGCGARGGGVRWIPVSAASRDKTLSAVKSGR